MNKEISDKIIRNAVKKPVKSLLNPVDNLLVLVLVINRDTGRVLDIVSKPGLLTANFTGYPQSKNTVKEIISALRKKGYAITEYET